MTLQRRTRAIPFAALLLLTAVTTCAQAELKTDLGFVDQKSASYKRFRSWVDAAAAGRPGYEFSATDAALMFSLTGKEKYCELAVGMVQAQVDEANAKIEAGQRPQVAGDSYLEAGPMIGALAQTLQTCAADISDAQRTQWSGYAEQTISNIWNPGAAQWGGKPFSWSGWSIDNPGNNYYYSFVEATMAWALVSNNERWLKLLREDKLPALQTYFSKLPGGGSLEGTGYGAAHMRLFAIYRTWKDSTGVDLANANSHARDSIRFWVHATMPTLDRFAPIGDQSRVSVPELYDYHRRLVLEARMLDEDEETREMASWWLNNISAREMSHGFNARHDLLPAGDAGSPPNETVFVAEGTGHVFARTGWDSNAMWLGFNAGPYLESHAHQDQGAFTLFAGDWLAVSENIWSHSGIQQGTEVQNVVRFERNGTILRQREGTRSSMEVTGIDQANGSVAISADLSPAYGADSGVRSWQRNIRFGGRKLIVSDSFSTSADVEAVFQINVPKKPEVNGRQAQAGDLHIRVVTPEDGVLDVLEWSSLDAQEFRSGWRIDVRGSGNAFVVELSDSPP
ncbi:hypothetical protein [Dokdonella sp.]|uniref:hypothetical protein n=1 Tax=Dokdonella sp. TaxID=2291710 RepID=UPI003529C7BC